MRNHIITVFALFIMVIKTSAQQDLKTQLKDKENLFEIMNVVDNYYKGQPDNWRGVKGADPKLKHWKRWEWYMSGRLGTNNELVNVQGNLISAKKDLDKRFPQSERSVNSAWTSIGPSSTTNGIGRADRIAFHPSDPTIFYVGTPAGGLWRTTNGGTTWTPLTDHLPSIGISGVVVDWNNPSTIYILTGDGDSANIGGFVKQFGYARKSIGVLKSTDSGATWKPTGVLDPADMLTFKLVQSPINPGTLLAATDLGVFKTTNWGATWQKTLIDNTFDIEFKPGDITAYASSNDKIYYSTDEGTSWTQSTFDVALDSSYRIELAVSPAQSNYVYALVGGDNMEGEYGGTYRSTTSGASFQLRSNTPNILGSSSIGDDKKNIAQYANALAVSNTNASKVIAGGIKIWTSANGGTTYPSQKNGYHGDIHELAYNPLDGKLYACDDGGIYMSDDDGDTWTAFTEGFRTSQIYHMAGTALDDDYILIGLQDNGVKLKSDNTSTFEHIKNADGFDLAFNPIDKTEFYATVNKGVRRFWNSGADDTSISPNSGDWFNTIRTHVSDENIVFYGNDTIRVSMDKGENWTLSFASGSWALETCPSNGDRVYAAGGTNFNINSNGTLSRTDDLGVSWTSLEGNPGFPPPNMFNKITDIAVNPGNSNSVYVTFGGFFDGVKVYRSADAGATWEDYSGTLPNIPINSIIVNEAADQVYIGTDLGVFYRHSSMNDWMPFNNNLPNAPVTGLFIDENNDKLFASTFGRGVWKADLADGCPGSLLLSGTFKGYNFYQASSQISTTNKLAGGLGTALFLKAGDRVIMKPGFRTQKYTLFNAYVGGCGEGDIPE